MVVPVVEKETVCTYEYCKPSRLRLVHAFTCTFQIVDKRIQFRYNLGYRENILRLSEIEVNDGQWHHVVVERFGKEVAIMLDGGEGAGYNYTFGDIMVRHKKRELGNQLRMSKSGEHVRCRNRVNGEKRASSNCRLHIISSQLVENYGARILT